MFFPHTATTAPLPDFRRLPVKTPAYGVTASAETRKYQQRRAKRQPCALPGNENTPEILRADDGASSHDGEQQLMERPQRQIDPKGFLKQLQVGERWEYVTAERPLPTDRTSGSRRKQRRTREWIKRKQSAVTKNLRSQAKKGRMEYNVYNVLLVVAACVCDEAEERVLIAQRPPGKRLSGKWEFPGGKVESRERPDAALVREIKEELNISLDIAGLTPATFYTMNWRENRSLLMVLYVCRGFTGEVKGMENQQFAWASFEDLRSSKYGMSEGDDVFRTWVLEHLDPSSAYAQAKRASSQAQDDGVHAATAATV